MTVPKINSAHGSDTRNIINRAIDLINVQGKSIQDLVAKGQLTPSQYASLIQTVNGLIAKGEITIDDLDKNNFKIDQTMVTDELLQQIAGTAEINAVPADGSLTTRKYVDKSVTPEKTSFFDLSKNLIDAENVKMNTSIDTNGEEVSETGRWLNTVKIPIKEGDILHFSDPSHFRIAIYSEMYGFISRTGSSSGANNAYTVGVLTTDDRYVLISGTANLDGLMVNKGPKLLPFENFGATINKNRLPDTSSEMSELVDEKIADFKKILPPSKNLFDKSQVTTNKTFSTDGDILDDDLWWASSQFIPVTVGDKLYFNADLSFRVAQYDDEKNFIGRSGTTLNPNVYTVNFASIKYIRISGVKENFNGLMVNRGSGSLPYEPYNPTIPKKYLSEDLLEKNELNIVYDALAKEPYPSKLRLETFYEGNDEPYYLSEDGEMLMGHRGSTVVVSFDEWETRVDVGSSLPIFVNGVRELSDGELIASTNRDDNNGIKAKLFKTINFDRNNPESAQWKQVLESNVSLANFQNSWGLEVYENIVLISEYGLHGIEGARYCYLSTDNAETFTPIFDLVNEDVPGRPNWTDRAHIHTVAYDHIDERIWLCTGDSTNRATYYSDDLGVNWSFVEGSNGIQFTGIVALNGGVVFGSDAYPNGLYIYRRKQKGEKVTIESWYSLNDHDYLSHIFQLPFRKNRRKNTPVYFNASSAQQEDNKTSTVIMGFADAFKAHLIYESDKKYSLANGVGVKCVLGDTAQGNVIAVFSEADKSALEIKKSKAPEWE